MALMVSSSIVDVISTIAPGSTNTDLRQDSMRANCEHTPALKHNKLVIQN